MLTPKISEKIARRYLLNKKTIDGEFFFAHTQGVVEAVKLLSQRFELDRNKMISLAWVHDIGYFSNDAENHAENSLKLLNDERIDLTREDKDCILNHGIGKNPLSKEGKIMQIADKISIVNKYFLKVLISNKQIKKDEIDFVKMMYEKAIEMFEKLNTLNEAEND